MPCDYNATQIPIFYNCKPILTFRELRTKASDPKFISTRFNKNDNIWLKLFFHEFDSKDFVLAHSSPTILTQDIVVFNHKTLKKKMKRTEKKNLGRAYE